ncbi:MAG: alpha-D-ribose 1-methylphosphonate 5-triphosphate diphosphatase [Devosia sp.]
MTASPTIFRNATIVLADEVHHGALAIDDGMIAAIGTDTAGGEDLDGDYLLPGLVELHTDHLETHYSPRPKVRWSPLAAVQAHDAQIAASGITTVLDALRVGLDEDSELTGEEMLTLATTIAAAKASGRLRADHFIHIRCEVSAPDCLDSFHLLAGHPLVRLASLMDHAPGQRQFATLESYRGYYQGKLKMSDVELDAFSDRRNLESERYSSANRDAISSYCRAHDIVLASHDDATLAHVDEAIAQGIAIAEFPTTLEAARASHAAGLAVLMGGPNVVRGGSHSGNIAASTLAAAGLLDIVSSDYVPFSLLQAIFVLSDKVPGISLPAAVRMVSKTPAEAAGLRDRGEIAVGRRADLVRVALRDGVPIVRAVWREGRRVI